MAVSSFLWDFLKRGKIFFRKCYPRSLAWNFSGRGFHFCSGSGCSKDAVTPQWSCWGLHVPPLPHIPVIPPPAAPGVLNPGRSNQPSSGTGMAPRKGETGAELISHWMCIPSLGIPEAGSRSPVLREAASSFFLLLSLKPTSQE